MTDPALARVLAALDPGAAAAQHALDALDDRRRALVAAKAARAGLPLLAYWRAALADTAWTVRHNAARAHAGATSTAHKVAVLRRAICRKPGADFVLARVHWH